MNKVGKLIDKNVLFLQGPMGNFFKKLDTVFRQKGATTYKIGFNGGDWFYSHKDNYIPYTKKKEEWENYVKDFLITHKIDKIFLFGDCRYYQSKAIKIAMELDIDIYVFEEGYVRPHYITMEKFGVNDYSQISRNPVFYQNLKQTVTPPVLHTRPSKFKMIHSASIYYLTSNILHRRYPYYRHHRDFSALKEFYYGVRGIYRKLVYTLSERKYLKEIERSLSEKYFFIPLQTHNDFQILQHSEYGSLEKFIIEVLESFSQHANKETWIIFKHHPIDRGRKNYKKFIMDNAKFLKVDKRTLVINDIHLPTCIKHAKGTITINSTVGLTSIGYKIPTITLGNAIYDIEGLTCKEMNLAQFWNMPKEPDEVLYHQVKDHLIKTTQLNGSFYGKFPIEFENDLMYS